MRHLLVLSLCLAASKILAADAIDFTADVWPILQSHCAGCHAGDEAEGGFVLDTHAGLIAGGDSGIAVTPGTASSSRLWLMVAGKLEPSMPPEDEPPLNESELAVIEAWIEQGAYGPAGDMPIRRELRTPKIQPDPGIDAPITAMAATGDGSLRAIARYGKIDLVDRDGSLVRTISGTLGKVNSLQFDRAGTRLLVASGATGAYGTAAIYAVDTGQRISEMLGHRDILYSAVFSPDESTVATAGYDREIILWVADTGEPRRKMVGHNGAIFDLAFSPDGKVLVSACADQTLKVWSVSSGERLDTLSQCEGEVFAVDVTADGQHVIAASADNRLRVWSLVSVDQPQINPLIATRFVDESPLVNFQVAPDGKSLVVLSESGNVKVIRTSDWNQAASLEPLGETASDLVIRGDSRWVTVALMNGRLADRELPEIADHQSISVPPIEPVYLDLGDPQKLLESDLRAQQGDDVIAVDRGVEVTGAISAAGQCDLFRWHAAAGEVWAIDADAIDNSRLDPIVTILDANDEPVLRTRLQAVRDSYFTFRGKDSSQSGDFRLFNWQEMQLNDYLYASGEVTRLFMHPRGPDSGFNVYPGEGSRWTYFGTSHRAHALGEPAYIVRPIRLGESPPANGLPIFDIYYENDDDPARLAGNNSRLLFTAPADGEYSVRITDTRGDGGEDFGYRLAIRAAAPGFRAAFDQPNATIRKGTGREFTVRVDRFDGFDGPVTFEIVDLPAGLISNSPITIERGQRFAVANLWADEATAGWEAERSARLVAHAIIGGRHVERQVGSIKKLKLEDRPGAIPSVHPIDRDVPENEAWTLQVRRGETATARILVRRKQGFNAEIRFGNETSGRNTSHGVYVDNIGLSGLLVREGETEREFFLTADPNSQPGKRLFHLTGRIDGNVTTHPIVVEVLP